jgi:very-short-patch-repair endonuclease
MTEAEIVLWSQLRLKKLNDFRFYRQRIVGNYIVDFFCPTAKLVIEVDGGQHYTEEGIKRDSDRDSYLKSLGLTILRFSDTDVLSNLEGVIYRILENLHAVE